MSLPQTLTGIDRWIYDHAMDCIAWIASEIDKYQHEIDPSDMWYQPDNSGDGPLIMAPTKAKIFSIRNKSDEYPPRIWLITMQMCLRTRSKQSTKVLRLSLLCDVSPGREEQRVEEYKTMMIEHLKALMTISHLATSSKGLLSGAQSTTLTSTAPEETDEGVVETHSCCLKTRNYNRQHLQKDCTLQLRNPKNMNMDNPQTKKPTTRKMWATTILVCAPHQEDGC